MLASHFFPAVLVFVLLQTHAHSCKPISDVVKSEQARYISYQQRGLPRDFIKPFYVSFLEDLKHFSMQRYSNTRFLKICFTDTDISDFYKFHDKNAIDHQIKVLEARFPHLPYLKASKQNTIPKDDRFKSAATSYFNETVTNLSEGHVSNAAALPRSLKVIYDPGRKRALKTYKIHASHSPKMKASDLLIVVTGMVITLELMKVPRMYSMQLLRHSVAWLSTMYRALQKDGPSVKVPVLFLPFYRHYFWVLRRQASVKAPLVQSKVVKSEIGKMLNVYTRVEAWGRLEVIRWDSGVSVWTIEQVLFDAVVLGRIAKKIGFKSFDAADHPPYNVYIGDRSGWGRVVANGLDGDEEGKMMDPFDELKGKVSSRTGNLCIEPLFEYLPIAVSTWEEACCATICCNVSLMMETGTSAEECCGDCNQLECAIEGTPLQLLAIVHLEPYGEDPGGAVPCSL